MTKYKSDFPKLFTAWRREKYPDESVMRKRPFKRQPCVFPELLTFRKKGG